jgi:hypothetical protein
MISNRFYFTSVFIASAILALITSLDAKDFLFSFLIYLALFFIIGVSITVFPFIYYNHFSELRILSKIPKYLPDQVINIRDANKRFYVSIQDKNFDVVPGILHGKYIDARVAFVDNYIEFYQYSSPYVLSYTPFLKINAKYINKIVQGKKAYSIDDSSIATMIKCNYFEIYENNETYKLIVLQQSTDKFINAIIASSERGFKI